MKRALLACLLALAVFIATPAAAHNGQTHLPPNFTSLSGRADADPIVVRDALPRVAQILDSMLGTRWRDRNYGVNRGNTCLHNVPAGQIETDICNLWEAQVLSTGEVFTPKTNSGLPGCAVANVCINLDQTLSRHQAINLLWYTLFNGYIWNGGEHDGEWTPYLSPSPGAPAWEHGRQTNYATLQGDLETSYMNFSSPCTAVFDAYNPGGGPDTCNHGRGYQIYTDVIEGVDTAFVFNRAARLSYPDLRVVEPWTTNGGGVIAEKWDPDGPGGEPELHVAEPMRLDEFVMSTGRLHCALLSATGGMVSALSLTPECKQQYWIDRNVAIRGWQSYWFSNDGGGFWSLYDSSRGLWSYLRVNWGWDDINTLDTPNW